MESKSTLVIHPKDETTDFLSVIYSDHSDSWTVIQPAYKTYSKDRHVSRSKLKQLIRSHDRIIMMGHGDQKGLYGGHGYVINPEFVQFLRGKYCIGIWCYARDFFTKYGLTGYSTGMIISEDAEAEYLGIRCTWEELQGSNKLFAQSMAAAVASNNLDDALEIYKGDCELFRFNRDNMLP